MTTPNDQESPTNAPYNVIGTRPVRHDGVDKVTGRAMYGADIQPPGVIHGKVLRSPLPTPASGASIPARPRPCPE